MARPAKPRVIDFGQCGDWGHRVFVNSLPGPKESYPERSLADLTGIKPIVLEHLGELAANLKSQDGYRSQFVALSEPYHTHLGADVDGVLDRIWRETKAVNMTRPKERPVADDEADNARPRVWKATDLEASKPKVGSAARIGDI